MSRTGGIGRWLNKNLYMKKFGYIRLGMIFPLFVCLCVLSACNRKDDGVVKILAIGNSFSENAMETHLYDIAKACGKEVVLGNLYIGGCSLERHRDNVNNDTPAYSYRKIFSDGSRVVRDSVTVAEAIPDEDWDYITFQQVSQKAGKYETFFPYLEELKSYVDERVTNKDVQYAMHMTWAYESGATHFGFPAYSCDQNIMFDSIVSAVNRAARVAGIEIVIPAGTAVQNARNSAIGDHLCIDGYHLNSKGKYVASCAWVETLLGCSTVGCGYIPEDIPAEEVAILQHAAHRAVMCPMQVLSE